MLVGSVLIKSSKNQFRDSRNTIFFYYPERRGRDGKENI
jgi:hypothetical protein